MSDFDGKLVIVTGGARGQGEAEICLFASRGAAVIVADVFVYEGEGLGAELTKDGREA